MGFGQLRQFAFGVELLAPHILDHIDVNVLRGLPKTLRKIESNCVATPAFSTIAAIAGVLGRV